MPTMRSASSRPDETGIQLGYLDCHCYLSNLSCFQKGLNPLDVAILRQPAWQTRRVPPSIRDGVIAQQSRKACLFFFTLRLHVAEGSDVRHGPSRCLSCACATVATVDPISATDLTDLRRIRNWFYLQLKYLSSAFALTTLGESRGKNLLSTSGT